MKVKKTDNFHINDNMNVTVTETGNIIEIRTMTSDVLTHIKKLNANEYVVLATGEVKEMNHQNARIDNVETLKQSFSYLRKIINSNITDKNIKYCRFVTLTYKENMKDTERLKKDLKEFYSKFKYYCNKRKVKPPEYITIIEPQGRGAWHAHIIFIFKKIPPFIPKAELEKIWGFGFVDIKAVDENCDNVGAYLSAYVGNLALDDVKDVSILENAQLSDFKEVEVTDENGNKKSKAYIKGLRLHLYPKGLRIFRYSKGIKLPNTYICSYGEAMEKVKGSKKTYEKSIELIDDKTGEAINKIKYEHYNKKRKDGVYEQEKSNAES